MKERQEASQNWGGTEPNRTVTFTGLKAMANDRRIQLLPCHDEFRGPRYNVSVDRVGQPGNRTWTYGVEARYVTTRLLGMIYHILRKKCRLGGVVDLSLTFYTDEAHFWLNGYVNKQNCRIWSEANPQVYVETPLHPEKLTVWCALWAGGILLQKR
ncbi:hypothetical protein TNCV_2069881 [Trichonephila clavipes]|uniref:Uncharacterized protein n=1 Tax=Trichonephila clavipes TaxID=2585209 RepID=A0A8X6W310_TRICX|nr:hypothetical protein TNCV_2069881 [Trichonephila clavipes]